MNKEVYTIKSFEDIKHVDKNGGTMPENLPTPKKSLKQLEKEKNKELNK